MQLNDGLILFDGGLIEFDEFIIHNIIRHELLVEQLRLDIGFVMYVLIRLRHYDPGHPEHYIIFVVDVLIVLLQDEPVIEGVQRQQI